MSTPTSSCRAGSFYALRTCTSSAVQGLLHPRRNLRYCACRSVVKSAVMCLSRAPQSSNVRSTQLLSLCPQVCLMSVLVSIKAEVASALLQRCFGTPGRPEAICLLLARLYASKRLEQRLHWLLAAEEAYLNSGPGTDRGCFHEREYVLHSTSRARRYGFFLLRRYTSDAA